MKKIKYFIEGIIITFVCLWASIIICMFITPDDRPDVGVIAIISILVAVVVICTQLVLEAMQKIENALPNFPGGGDEKETT